MTELTYKNKKWNAQKAIAFGFSQVADRYKYTVKLADGPMELTVTVEKGTVSTEIIDTQSGEEYVLHRVPEASGAFVGQIRTEYEEILETIGKACFDPDIFQSEQAKDVILYARETYGDALEYLWQKFPDNAVLRRQDNKKWYAALLTVSRRKLGFDSEERIEILDLRMTPERIGTEVDGIKILPGYHMNKKHWITICLDGSVPTDEIYRRIEESYQLALK